MVILTGFDHRWGLFFYFWESPWGTIHSDSRWVACNGAELPWWLGTGFLASRQRGFWCRTNVPILVLGGFFSGIWAFFSGFFLILSILSSKIVDLLLSAQRGLSENRVPHTESHLPSFHPIFHYPTFLDKARNHFVGCTSCYIHDPTSHHIPLYRSHYMPITSHDKYSHYIRLHPIIFPIHPIASLCITIIFPWNDYAVMPLHLIITISHYLKSPQGCSNICEW